jgi:putative tricarboxylic transport membrane protein
VLSFYFSSRSGEGACASLAAFRAFPEMMMPRVLASKSVLAGLVFIGLALVFGISAASLSMGTAARMGPGYFPMLLAAVLAFLGLLVAIEGALSRDEIPDRTSFRSVALVAGSVIVFALSIESLGLVPAVAFTSFLLSAADRRVDLGSALAAAAVLALFSWAVFTVALSMPWPAFGYLLR